MLRKLPSGFIGILNKRELTPELLNNYDVWVPREDDGLEFLWIENVEYIVSYVRYNS